MRPFTLHQPSTIREALDVLTKHPNARVIAGGTDVLTLLRDAVIRSSQLVDIAGIGLHGIRHHDDGTTHIGATTRNNVADRRLRERFPALIQALSSGASPQIRNMATFGGNLLQHTRCPYYRQPEFACNRRAPGSGCAALHGDRRRSAIFGASRTCLAVHPSDLAVALAALDAIVVVEGKDGIRRIPARGLHRPPGTTPERPTELHPTDLLTSIELTTSPRARRSRYVKFRDRASFTFAVASAAVALDVAEGVVRSARIVLGGVAPLPWAASKAEEALVGRTLDDEAISAASKAATHGVDISTRNEYKVELVQRVVHRALSDLGGRS
ncbi:FAD binding domain-containing protein [Amycolatopsis keratiniphila]|uniref:FAD-binding molybdopterin dehydrogenase n=1 Tax=Amycolatopsis keratiniphila subsp. keratiniphila TaxID=227715 RepID=A0A1W2M2V9_9PSEU|nr:xanthine dehydrogenase family protein subunit M [Amycolatopsis keratiniphila]ONF74377.1 FAD-binding molybdopterin dehydrogenase [Amycolatopsis keratiniphila subsp. keratiniphila]